MSRHTARKSQMVNQFAMLPSVSIPRSAFKRPHGYKTTMDAGYLVPIYAEEVLPGDSFKVKASLLARLATPITPFMDNVYLETFFFFVPNRILWNHWVNMMGERENPDDSVDFICPVDTAPAGDGWTVGSLYDYFGVPTGVPGIQVNALFRRAYYRIFNEWFRDENLQDSNEDGLENGDSGQTKDFQLLRRNKFKDYFTASMPWPQKGEASSIGLAGDIPIDTPDIGALITPKSPLMSLGMNATYYERVGASSEVIGVSTNLGVGVGNNDYFRPIVPGGSASLNTTGIITGPIVSGGDYFSDLQVHDSADVGAPDGTLIGSTPVPDETSVESRDISKTGFRASISGLTAQMSKVGLLDINSIREAFQIQKLLEKDARGGSRYVEQNIVHFGVRSPDARLQRPEYLGGSRTPLYVNAVAQTSATDSTTPQGNLSAYGVASDSFHGFTKSFVEHGVIIGLANIRADLSYQQGIHRKWSRLSRFDYYYPVFAHLGEQAVLNKEIFAQGPTVLNEDQKPVDDDAFGYQERYAEYRYAQSLITGKMRSTYAQSLDIWHLAQEFESLPKLNVEFIQEDPPIDRVIAVQDEPQFIVDIYFDEVAVRPMPIYSVPGLVDHF